MSSEISEIMADSKHVLAHVSETQTDFNASSENMNAGKSVIVKTEIEQVAECAPVTETVEVTSEINEASLKAENGADLKVTESKTLLEEPMAKLLLVQAAGDTDTTDSRTAEQPCLESVKKNILPKRESRVIVTNKSSASLTNLLVYESSEESTDNEDENDADVSFASKNNVIIMDSSSSSYGSTELFSEMESDSSLSEEEELSISKPQNTGYEKKLENKFGDYIGKDPLPTPDLSKLNLNVQPKDLLHIGRISAMVDEFVMVEAISGMPPYNLDTYMFLEDCTFLGAVFDVMGPVSSPIYVLRFRSAVDVAKLNVNVDVKVFVSPRGEHTKYVFLRDLLSVRGSDASWVGDVEVPEEFEDFSDDEKESRRKAGFKGGSRKRNSLERHRTFEHKMNKKNTMDSVCQIVKHQGATTAQAPQNYQYLPPPLAVPVFDPQTPPPQLQGYHSFFPCPPPGQVMPPNFQSMPGNWGCGAPQPPGY